MPRGARGGLSERRRSISGRIFVDFGRFSVLSRVTRSGSAPGPIFRRFLVDFRRAREKPDMHSVWEKPMRNQGRPFARRLRPRIDGPRESVRKSTPNRPEIVPKARQDAAAGPLGGESGRRLSARRAPSVPTAPEGPSGPPPDLLRTPAEGRARFSGVVPGSLGGALGFSGPPRGPRNASGLARADPRGAPRDPGADLGSIWGRFGVDSGSILGRFRVDFGSMLGRVCIDCGGDSRLLRATLAIDMRASGQARLHGSRQTSENARIAAERPTPTHIVTLVYIYIYIYIYI